MTDIQLLPEHGGEPITIPKDKTTIGRGPLMKVTDKRVSRHHAKLEVNSENQLVITPIHTNPCFLKATESGEKVTLPKDKPQVLQHGDILGLLPDSLYFKVIYLHKGQTSSIISPGIKVAAPVETKSHNNITDSKREQSNNTESNARQQQNNPVKTVKAGKHELAMPLEKMRQLPKWMLGASKRVNLNPPKANTNNAPVKPRIATSIQSPNKSPTNIDSEQITPKKGHRGAPKKRAQSSEEEEWEEEVVPQGGRRSRGRRKPESESEEEISPTRRSGTPRSARARRKIVDESNSKEGSEEEEESMVKTREPRMSAQKLLTYKDEFDLSDVGFSSSSESEAGGQFGSHKKESDSDFVMDDIDSGSDWEISHSQSSRSGRRKGRPRGTPPSRTRRRSVRKGRKRPNYDDSDLDFTDEEAYIPRPSKRRASNTKSRRNYSEDDYSEEEKPVRGRRKSKRKVSDDSEEEELPKKRNRRGRKVESEESEDELPKKRSKRGRKVESEEELPKKSNKRGRKVESEEELPKKSSKRGRKVESEESEVELPKKSSKQGRKVESEEELPKKMSKRDRNVESEESEEDELPKKSSKRGRNVESEESEEDELPKKSSKRGRKVESEESEEEELPSRRGRTKVPESDEDDRKKTRNKWKTKKAVDEDDDDMSEESIVKKTNNTKKVDISDEDDIESTKKKKKMKKKTHTDDEDDMNDGKHRQSCFYGKKCYRKNPKHFEEFCHPGDSSFDEEESKDPKPKGQTKRPMREKDKLSVLAGASDDDGEANTYDYNDSFMAKDEVSDESSTPETPAIEEDSDWEPDDENVKSLVQEAKGFIRNKKLHKPSRNN